MRALYTLLSFVFFAITAQAHVVPNMTIEAEFAADHRFILKLNVDPRVFLSDQPTSLPPVTADWYLSQSDSEKQATYVKATEYLKANVGLTFNDQTIPLPPCDFVAMDGATNEPVKPDTAETHLLATAKGQVPADADSFKIAFGKTANVSLILLNSEEGNEDRRPQVIFPGETSRPFKIAKARDVGSPSMQLGEVTVTRVYPEAPKVFAIIGGSVVLIFIAAVFFLRRSKRR